MFATFTELFATFIEFHTAAKNRASRTRVMRRTKGAKRGKFALLLI